MSSRTQAAGPLARDHRRMLWSDMRREEPSREARTTRAMLRRVGWVIALAGLIGTSLVMLAQPPA
ncbi:hypothetical protein HUT13_17800 [Streptomyces harbinensis]|nr:hypothetical protein HUT13_17800 [Streptomyces harbinensis]